MTYKTNFSNKKPLIRVGSKKDLPRTVLIGLKFSKIIMENILALRGDRTDGAELCGDFRHASDLIAFIRDNYDLNILAAPTSSPAR